MRLLAAALLAVLASASRRLQIDECQAEVYVVAQGAATEQRRGLSFAEDGADDPRLDESGAGRRLLASMPPCHREVARSLKVRGEAQRTKAVIWLSKRCAGRDCIVYSLEPIANGNYQLRQ